MFKNIRTKIALALSAALVAVPLLAPGVALAKGSDTTTTTDVNNSLCSGADLNLSVDTGSCSSTTNTGTTKVNNLVHTVINIFSLVVGIVSVIMIIVGGFRYVTSGGASDSVSGAKNTIVYAIIGLVVVALAQFIVQFVLGKVTNSGN